MKSSSKTSRLTAKKPLVKQSVKTVKRSVARVSVSSPSRLGKSAKRFAKQTLREILLSKTFHASFKVIAIALIASGLTYGGYLAIDRTFANQIVVSKSEIVRKVEAHIALPAEEPEAVVRVQDAEALKKQNPFYVDVKTGDYILVYKRMAIIYDLRNDTIVAMKQTGEGR